MNKTNHELTCIDLFAGCGGLSLGLEQAGFRPLLFSEINPSAAETYIANRVGMGVIPVADVYNLTDTNLELLKKHWAMILFGLLFYPMGKMSIISGTCKTEMVLIIED